MDYIILPTTKSPYQVFFLPACPDGHAFQSRVELRYLPAPDAWFLSIADTVTGQVYVNQIPVICSYEVLNDLLFPFRYLFQGSGIGSLFCLKAVENPSTQNPSKDNLSEFQILWGNQLADASGVNTAN